MVNDVQYVGIEHFQSMRYFQDETFASTIMFL